MTTKDAIDLAKQVRDLGPVPANAPVAVPALVVLLAEIERLNVVNNALRHQLRATLETIERSL